MKKGVRLFLWQKGEAFNLSFRKTNHPAEYLLKRSETNPVTEGYVSPWHWVLLPAWADPVHGSNGPLLCSRCNLFAILGFLPPLFFTKKNDSKRDSKVAMSRLKLMNLPELCLIIASESLTYIGSF